MRMRGRASLAFLPIVVGAALAGAALAGATSAADGITVYRCEGADGVTLQDEPCSDGDAETSRRMVRPQDPPAPKPRSPRGSPSVADPAARGDDAPPPDTFALPPPLAPPPPPMFRCTDFDGATRHSEEYAPNDRCVPLAVLGYGVPSGSPAAATCRWVAESCLRLDDDEACEQFRAKLKQARSDALHASASRAPYLRSEAERLARIVGESC